MKKEVEQYFMDYGPIALRFELAGDLNDEVARKLDDDWRTASAIGCALIVDLTFVTVEEEERTLLTNWCAAGAQLIAQSNVSRKLAKAIIGDSLLAFASARGAGADGTWLPFCTPASAIRQRVAAECVAKTQKPDSRLKLGWPPTGVWQ